MRSGGSGAATRSSIFSRRRRRCCSRAIKSRRSANGSILWQRHRKNRRRRSRGSNAPPGRARNRSCRGVLSVCLRQSGAREGGGGNHPIQIAPASTCRSRTRSNPEWREYERTASTVANAYIGPPVSRYLRELGEAFTAPLSTLACPDDEIRRRRRERAHARTRRRSERCCPAP